MEKVFFFVFALLAPAFAQNRLVIDTGATPAATAPAYDVSFGYIFHSLLIPGAAHDSLSGFDASTRLDLNPRWAAMLDSNYIRTSNLLGTGQDGHVLSFLAGPEFYLIENGNSRVFFHALAGPGLVNSPAPASDPAYSHGWSTRLSYSIGAGVERPIYKELGLRIGGDYVGKPLVGSSDVVVAASILFRPRPHFVRSR